MQALTNFQVTMLRAIGNLRLTVGEVQEQTHYTRGVAQSLRALWDKGMVDTDRPGAYHVTRLGKKAIADRGESRPEIDQSRFV